MLPHPGDLFLDEIPAAATILNGFGKSVGHVQVEELAGLDTPIALTHTFSIGTFMQAQMRHAIAKHPSTEQAILNTLWHADTLVGRDGHRPQGLRDRLSVPSGPRSRLAATMKNHCLGAGIQTLTN